MKKKYLTEEERKAARRESQRKWAEKNKNYQRRWYQDNKEKRAAYQAEYYQNNKEKTLERLADYYQNNKEKITKQHAEYYQSNKEKTLERLAEYRQNNKEKIAKRNAEYYSTPKGRANMLLKSYRYNDKLYNRGECTLTPEWIVEHIFNQPCHYCGKTDWHELGCDRIDNSLPHRPDNVVPCCCECNKKKARYSYDEYMKMIGKIA